MNQNFEKLKTLLKVLFQLDQPELDFGLYQIMHAKGAEITKFLDSDLLPQVKHAFGSYKSTDKVELERELAKAIEQAQALGADPEILPKVKELRAKISDEAVDVVALENEVYDHLFSFFRRYYSDGDFLAKRIYKPGVYAIPYEGEEIKLYWANSDQYYIKTSEYLRDYVFRLRPDDSNKPMRVHFRLADAAEGEHGNVKEANGKERVFVLKADGFIAEENSELVIRFEYRSSTVNDWPDDLRKGKTKPPGQRDLIALAAKSVLAVSQTSLAAWIRELGRRDPTETEPDRTILEKHIKKYSDINTFDYFIHKDLRGFLRRELDFYIKNEVMHLDDIESDTAPRVEQYLSKIKVIRRIAGKIIDFLAQLENFQKKLWLKRKFVVETQYCIALGDIPENLYPEIASNDAQRDEWVRLFAIDSIKADQNIPGYSLPLRPEFLRAHPSLIVDTSHFTTDFASRLIEVISDIDNSTDAIVIQAENYQGLQTIAERYKSKCDVVYIDPPYNTDASAIIYKNDYKHSSWMSLIENRLMIARHLMPGRGVLCFAIDDEEISEARQLLGSLFAKEIGVAVVRSNPQSRKAKGTFSPAHEYALFYGKSKEAMPGSLELTEKRMARYPKEDEKGRFSWMNFIRTGTADRRADRPKLYYPIFVAEDDTLRIPKMSWSDEKGEYGEYILDETPKSNEVAIFPVVDTNGSRTEKRWHRGHERVSLEPDEYRVRRDAGGNICIDFKTRLDEDSSPVTWWDKNEYASANYGAVELKALFGTKPFDFPKALTLVTDCLRASNTDFNSVVLDYFAGSGTTGHAVINLNREDGGRRKFILIEAGNSFDDVVLPRLKKVSFSPDWSDGRPKRLATQEEAARSPRIFKVIRLESYEDALNNLIPLQSTAQESLLRAAEAQGVGGFKEHYMLRYMLDVETRNSPSLLNVQAFRDPTAYKIKVKQPGSDESRVVNVDLLETFNWLIGLSVQHIAAPQAFAAEFERDNEKRLRLKGRLKQDAAGPWWFRTVTGTMPDGRRTLVIWRKLNGETEQDNLVLDEWFDRIGYSTKDFEFSLIYVNGGNNLENLRGADQTWKVRPIEEDFHRLMFAVESI